MKISYFMKMYDILSETIGHKTKSLAKQKGRRKNEE